MSWLRGLGTLLIVACGESDGGKAQPAGSSSASGSGTVAGAPGSEGGADSGGADGAGAPSAAGGGPAGLVDCDPRKILCRIAPPDCGPMSVPSVQGTCYGPCVAIDTCACSSAAECPDELQYTCWSRTHCGPYVH
jgi:hypothetical protein